MYLERFSILIISLIASGCLFVASLSSTSDRPEKSSSNNSQKDDLVIEAAKLDQLVQEERVYNFDRLEALNDPYARISTEFDIPNSLKMRVAFWFDIYTLYNKNQHVIHHTLFPWIVYEVVDISNFLNNGKGPLWLRKQRGLDYVKARKKYIRNVLRKLSKSRSFKRLKSFERDIYNSLLKIPGKRALVFKQASQHIRAQLGQKDFFISGLENSSKYLEQMETVFKNVNLPDELTRIPFVESSFNEKAQSRVGASGVWQIMPHVGKKFSIVNNYIDERNSPIKASKVAAKLLKQNYKILKSWPLAITAYNNGIGNIKKAIHRANSRQLYNIIAKNHQGAFKFASSNFYCSFLAALHAEKYHLEIFPFMEIDKEEALKKQSYRLRKSWRPITLAKKAEMDINTLLTYNLDLKRSIRKNRLLPKGFTLMLPPKKAKEFESKLF